MHLRLGAKAVGKADVKTAHKGLEANVDSLSRRPDVNSDGRTKCGRALAEDREQPCLSGVTTVCVRRGCVRAWRERGGEYSVCFVFVCTPKRHESAPG